MNKTPNPAIPKAALMKNNNLKPWIQATLLTNNISSPKRAQLSPAKTPYLGSKIVPAEVLRLFITPVN